MLPFSEREFSTLSGGEKQRVLIARAIAQNPKILILDEPTNHLDPRYQLEIMNLIKSLQITTIVAMHDLNIAAAYCDKIYLLNAGEIVTSGRPLEVLTAKNIRGVYGVKARVKKFSRSGKLNIAFIGVDK